MIHSRLPRLGWLTSASKPLLRVASDTPTQAVIQAMHCAGSGYALVVEQQRLIGIFTEQDIVAAIARGQSLEGAIADQVQPPLIALSVAEAQDLRAVAHQLQQHQLRYLPIVDAAGEPLAVIALQTLMEEQLRSQAQREQALNRVIQSIRSSLDLKTIFATATREVAQLLQVDRAGISQYLPQREVWVNVASYQQGQSFPNLAGFQVPDAGNPFSAQLKRFEVVRVCDTRTIADDINRPFAQAFPGAWLLVPLTHGDLIWGSLNLVRQPAKPPDPSDSLLEAQPIGWQDAEVELTIAVADQLAIAIQQSELYQQVQQLNSSLETQVEERTRQLQTLLNFEALLKRITDKVRESLDEHQIIGAAVEELSAQLAMPFCNAIFYENAEAPTETVTIVSEVNTLVPELSGLVLPEADFPMMQAQIVQGESCQFCAQVERWGWATMLICPMVDNDGTLLGDLLLLRACDAVFDDLETRLVEQVAGQCAIAIRQSRLYKAAQKQVEELERLSQLKDDFLSTVSHELRTPMSNIKMTAEMLELTLRQRGPLLAEAADRTVTKVDHYFQILREECHREINLINDLLDISRLDAKTEPLIVATMRLQAWLPHIVEAFADRMSAQQQSLRLDLPEALPPLTTDFSHLERILTELLQNACKYTPAGHAIVVSAQFSDKYQIQVANSGVEIPPAEHSHIFEKFYRIASNDPWKHGGTGLGLALVKKRVEQIQGTIAISTQPGWTILTVTLPAQLS